MYLRLFIIAILLVSSSAYADTYKYVDTNGAILFTDTPRRLEGGRVSETPTNGLTTARTEVKGAYGEIITRKAEKYDVDPELIKAVISTESNYDSRAVSRSGAQGLMQLMPATAKDVGVSRPFNPEENIEGGTRYLRYLLNRYDGDLTRALAAYNAGPGRVDRDRSFPDETKRYIQKVFHRYGRDNAPSLSKTVIYRVMLDDGRVIYTNQGGGRSVPGL